MKKYYTTIIVAVVVGALGFYGGMQFASSKKVSLNFAQNGARQGGNFAMRSAGGGGRNGANGGFVNGSILSKDDKSIVVQLGGAIGGSKIVFYSTSTKVMKSAVGTADDLSVGANVMVSGNANPDGSVNAESIQLRPTSINNQNDSQPKQ